MIFQSFVNIFFWVFFYLIFRLTWLRTWYAFISILNFVLSIIIVRLVLFFICWNVFNLFIFLLFCDFYDSVNLSYIDWIIQLQFICKTIKLIYNLFFLVCGLWNSWSLDCSLLRHIIVLLLRHLLINTLRLNCICHWSQWIFD